MVLKSIEGGFGWVDCKLNHQTRRTMSHLAREGAKGKGKGEMPHLLSPLLFLQTQALLLLLLVLHLLLVELMLH